MTKSVKCFFGVLISVNCVAQVPPVKDTLIPKQHLNDTIPHEPKLTGGALIDTINTKDKKYKYQFTPVDSSQKSPTPHKDTSQKKIK